MISKFIFIICLATLLACAKNGDAGPAGPVGATGPSGSNGTDKFTQIMNCSHTISGLSGAAGTALNGLVLNYNVGVTYSGNAFVNAYIASASYQISGSSFYASTQTGALVGGVAITDDFATANGGYWVMTSSRSSGTFTASYNDISLGGQSPVTIAPGTSACTLQSF